MSDGTHLSDPSEDIGLGDVRIELVDGWHKDWPRIRTELEAALGAHQSLGEPEDGWLSARQSLLVAFRDARIVGHVLFHLDLTARHDSSEANHIEAHIDSVGVDESLAHLGIERALRQAALERVHVMHAERMTGFDLAGWR